MKQSRSKKAIIMLIAVGATVNLVFAAITEAAIRRPPPAATQQTANQPRPACAALKQVSANIAAGILKREQILTNNADAGLQKLAATQVKQDKLLAAERAKQDNLKKTIYGKLDAAAQTEAQKQAVAEFQVAVERAENARRAAMDEAARTFREGAQKVLAERKQAGRDAMAEFKNTAANYLRAAETTCNAGNINPLAVRATLRTNILSVQGTLLSRRQEINKNARTATDGLIKTRRAAVQKTADNFKTAMQNAAAELKQNFK